MNIIALHGEFKADGKLGHSGPGDTLRLAHALRHPFFERNKRNISLVSTFDQSHLEGLFCCDRFERIPATDCQVAGTVSVDFIFRLLSDIFREESNKSCIVHAFIGKEENYPFKGILETIDHSKKIARQRIDSTNPSTSYMFHDRWDTPRFLNSEMNSKNSCVAVFIRNILTAKNLNSPPGFIDIVREILHEKGLSIIWCGDHDIIECQGNEKKYERKGHSFSRQISYLRSHAKFAIGWNSGGLDLAAAAGLPVLRIGEYQTNLSLCDEECSVRREYKWGERYNSYLVGATNIGLAPNRLDACCFNLPLLSVSLRSFLRVRTHNQYEMRAAI